MAWKIGDKGIIVRSVYGNEGIIVEITGLTSYPQTWNGIRVGFFMDVIVKSLGSPITLQMGGTDGALRSFQECPFPSTHIRKLPELPEEEKERDVVIVR